MNMAPESTALTMKAKSESPYQLDKAQASTIAILA